MTNNTPTRLPIAREFYSGNCLQQIRSFITGFEIPENYPDKFIGAVIPHAGWCYSGQTTARTLYCVSKRSDPEVCIIFGADHSGISKHSILPKGFWDTPLGVIPIAEKLCDKIIKTLPNFLSVDIKAQNREHSIEVCAPMVQYFFPKIQIIPIIVRPEINSLELGKQVAIIVKDMGKSAIVLASSDLTHYGDYYGLTPAGLGDSGFLWMKTNDLRIINCMLSCDGREVLTEAKKSLNACGAGAIAALLGFVVENGTNQGILVEYTTSHGDDAPIEEFTYGVGYAGVVY